jgi:hypothetical protein
MVDAGSPAQPVFIVPGLHCSLPMLHSGHLFGDPPGAFLCDGDPLERTATDGTCPWCHRRALALYRPLGEKPRGALWCRHCYHLCRKETP